MQCMLTVHARQAQSIYEYCSALDCFKKGVIKRSVVLKQAREAFGILVDLQNIHFDDAAGVDHLSASPSSHGVCQGSSLCLTTGCRRHLSSLGIFI